MENNPVGVRKGKWTPEEDSLLRKCIETYGEGKWHLVPLRAGLNRCRKSCRMRWFNYLKPSIKRGRFTKDEVDLIIRLHKLLGNRWTLIAGRLPGRTANDVKNLWNSHIDKKLQSAGVVAETSTPRVQKTITATNIVRPKTRALSNFHVPTYETNQPNIVWTSDENPINKQLHPSSEVDECIRWWSNLLQTTTTTEIVVDEDHHQTRPCPKEMWAGSLHDSEDNVTPQVQGDVHGLNDFPIDEDVWELIKFGKE